MVRVADLHSPHAALIEASPDRVSAPVCRSLAQPGEAAPEPYPASLRGLDEAALARTPTGRPWVAEPYGSFSLELGDPPSSRQHQRVEDGSQASVKPDPPEQREPPVSETALVTLGGLP